MSLKQTLCAYELIDSAVVNGDDIVALFKNFTTIEASSKTVRDGKGQSDFVRIVIPGTHGKRQGNHAPTLGIIGRLGGIGARPSRIGLVSDADGAIAAIATALKLAEMREKGDVLMGDVIITTHICPTAPTRPHSPVDFMDSPLNDETMNENEAIPEADAILSVDTTKGNRLINHKGYALSPTVKDGYILPVSEDLLHLMEWSSGQNAVTFRSRYKISRLTATDYITSIVLCSQQSQQQPLLLVWLFVRRQLCRVVQQALVMKWILPHR